MPSQPTSAWTAELTERRAMSPMCVWTLIVAAVCSTLVIVDALASADSAWNLSRDVAALFRIGASVGWVAFFATYLTDRVLRRVDRRADRVIHCVQQAHLEMCERAEKMHHETREHIANVSVEVAVAHEQHQELARQNQELRELFNALIAHITAYGDSRETDGRIAAIRELADEPQAGVNGALRPLRPTRPAAN